MVYKTPADAIIALEAVSGKLDKQAICEQAVNDSTEFYQGAQLAYDPFIKFGVRKVPLAEVNGPGLSFEDFDLLCTKLQARELTGHAARDAIEASMALATVHQWNNWYRRILLRDFRCGVTDSTINKAIKKATDLSPIKTYSCQLAYPAKDKPKKLTGKKWLETKYDGARLNVVVFPDGEVLILSREGRPITNFPHIAEQFSKTASWHDEAVMYDGEVVSGAFYEMMSSFKQKKQLVANDAVLVLFDYCPWKVIQESGTFKQTQRDRRAKLCTWHEQHSELLSSVEIIEHEEVDLDTEEGRKAASIFNLKMAELSLIDPKVEGVMYKDPDGFYHTKRSDVWLKEKPFVDVTLEIVDAYRGEEGKEFENVLGGFTCKGFDLGKHIEVDCGGGYTHEMRHEFWANKDKLIGRLIEIRCDCLTPPREDGTVSLRFPVFQRFRDSADRPGEII